MISVYVRSSIIQLATPDALRGRVSALNMVCIGASNELGEFRAGSIAAGIGAAPAILFGGACSLLIAGAWSLLCPSLRNVNTLSELNSAAAAVPPASAGRSSMLRQPVGPGNDPA